MTPTNKLADALCSDIRSSLKSCIGVLQERLRNLEALAEHDAQPAPAQPTKNVFSIKNKGARFPICGNCGDTFAGHEPTPPYACLPPTEPCCNAAGTFACKCNTFQPVPAPQPAPAPVQVDPQGNDRLGAEFKAHDAHPPAPAADGAGDAGVLEILLGEYTATPTIAAALRAAIAALRQPVPDAVRELLVKWREEADLDEDSANRNGAAGHERLASALKRRAVLRRELNDQLESALASQQESRK
jgi:hypothetical protein